MKHKIPFYIILFSSFFQKISAQPWLPLGNGVNGFVYALCVDSQSNLLYVGGDFVRVGDNLPVENLAVWDGNAWLTTAELPHQVNDLQYYHGKMYAALDDGLVGYIQDSRFVIVGSFSGTVNTLGVWKDTLYAGGYFITSYNENEDVTVNHIARFDSIFEWHALGNGINVGSNVKSLYEYKGDLIAGGAFEKAGDTILNNIGRWDGYNWHSMGSGVTTRGKYYLAYINALDTFQNKLIVGGDFKQVDEIEVHSLATWSGKKWDTLAQTRTDVVNVLYSANEVLYVSGDLKQPIMVWNGIKWDNLNFGRSGAIYSNAFYLNNLYVGGLFPGLNDSLNNIAYLDYSTNQNLCTAPYAGQVSDITSSAATLTWLDSSTIPTSYRIYYKVKNTTGWQKVHAKTKNKALKGLLTNTTYSWMVGTKCDTSHSGFSQRYEFTTLTEKKSLSEDYSQFNFSIFPNPGNGQINIVVISDNSSPLILKIYDMAGRVVYSDGWINGGSNDKLLDLSTLQPGIYSMQLLCNNQEAIRKMVLIK
ncbi:MAG: T9SS type A sorting domain-containing protein [Chitinophagales bacterium]|nr:T9SS type A sorting domain-containing protein [Chitinophagales bacterium]